MICFHGRYCPVMHGIIQAAQKFLIYSLFCRCIKVSSTTTCFFLYGGRLLYSAKNCDLLIKPQSSFLLNMTISLALKKSDSSALLLLALYFNNMFFGTRISAAILSQRDSLESGSFSAPQSPKPDVKEMKICASSWSMVKICAFLLSALLTNINGA